jgi:hypothetical protein
MIQMGYLDVRVHRRGVGEILVVVGSSSMLESMEENAVQTFSKGNNFLPHCAA